MKTSVKARNLELSDRLRATIERKMRRLDRISHPDAEATVELITNASHAADSRNVAEVTLVSGSDVVRSVSAGATPVAAIDLVIDKLERQVVRAKTRPRRVRERAADETIEVLAREALGTLEPPPQRRSHASPRVTRTKRFDMIPMFEEDAITRMEELGHAFFIFLNAENEQLCLVYRRSNGTYGLIEPVVRPSRGRP
jgi:putative sigma-54 modulation protein